MDETLLSQMSNDIEAELMKKRLSQSSRRQLNVDRLIIAFMQQNLETQRRVNVMWSVFRPFSVVASIAVTAIIGIIVSGKVEIIIK